jgi:hypothetical protein
LKGQSGSFDLSPWLTFLQPQSLSKAADIRASIVDQLARCVSDLHNRKRAVPDALVRLRAFPTQYTVSQIVWSDLKLENFLVFSEYGRLVIKMVSLLLCCTLFKQAVMPLLVVLRPTLILLCTWAMPRERAPRSICLPSWPHRTATAATRLFPLPPRSIVSPSFQRSFARVLELIVVFAVWCLGIAILRFYFASDATELKV